VAAVLEHGVVVGTLITKRQLLAAQTPAVAVAVVFTMQELQPTLYQSGGYQGGLEDQVSAVSARLNS
jgi:hypothetical protein